MNVLKNGFLVLPEGVFCGDLVLDGEKIVQVGGTYEASANDTAIDVTGKYVFPGFIDAHTHMQCWTGMDWTADSFETGTRAAACGGTTTIVDYATQDKGMTLTEALDEWHRRADGTCTANYAFHMAIADWNDQAKADMQVMRDAGVMSFKTYFAYDHLRLDDAQTLEVLERIRDVDGVLCVHCENGTLVNEMQRRMIAAGITGPEGHPMSRPAACEAEAISRLCYLAELADARINIVHLSSALGLEAVRASKARGKVKMDVETCPQYLLLDDSRYLESDFEGAKFENRLGAQDFARLMSEGPARVFGMYPRKGILRVGSDADVTVWDPSVTWTISEKNQHQNVDYTPYEGFEIHGRPAYVFVNGELAVVDGEPTGVKPGAYVKR